MGRGQGQGKANLNIKNLQGLDPQTYLPITVVNMVEIIMREKRGKTGMRVEEEEA